MKECTNNKLALCGWERETERESMGCYGSEDSQKNGALSFVVVVRVVEWLSTNRKVGGFPASAAGQPLVCERV